MREYRTLTGTKYHLFWIAKNSNKSIWYDSYTTEAAAELDRLELAEKPHVAITYITKEEIK